MPFNVSLGLPLADYPLVRAALAILELSFQEIPFAEASRLLRSPFLAGAESEMAARAKLDARIRREIAATVSLAKLTGFVEGCPVLRAALEKVFQAARAESQSPQAWARHFSGLLEAAGFPGERSLDSDEFQTRAKWHETLGEFAKLERVAKTVGIQQAFSLVQDLCRKTLFQPESGDAPIQVLGILESAGAGFDHLWVSGLTDERWPLAANPNPFIPIALQKKAGIPEASAEGSLALDRRITEGWLGAAEEVVLSFPEKENDRSYSASPLIAQVPEAPLAVPQYPRHRDLIFAARSVSSLEEGRAPAVTAKQVRGGTRVLADQAACPFRAFARWRLAAEQLEEPADGLDAGERGSLLHALMKHLWSFLKDSSALNNELEPAIARAAAAAVKELEIEGRFAELERERLARLAREWLEVEKTRPPFKVIAWEEQRKFEVAGLQFTGRIDRMDEVEGAGHVLIDYKTSRAPTPKHWEPPRPHDPQLPIYAICAGEEIAAVAFAKLRPGAMRYMGFSRDKEFLPKVIPAKNWPALLAGWKDEAEALGTAFAAGEARVDPKKEFATCRLCDLQTLCRVFEKVNPLKEEDEPE
jgi:probable DNA repair protein